MGWIAAASVGAVSYGVESQDETTGEWKPVDSENLDFGSNTTACNVTVQGCGRSYAFRVFAVERRRRRLAV